MRFFAYVRSPTLGRGRFFCQWHRARFCDSLAACL